MVSFYFLHTNNAVAITFSSMLFSSIAIQRIKLMAQLSFASFDELQTSPVNSNGVVAEGANIEALDVKSGSQIIEGIRRVACQSGSLSNVNH